MAERNDTRSASGCAGDMAEPSRGEALRRMGTQGLQSRASSQQPWKPRGKLPRCTHARPGRMSWRRAAGVAVIPVPFYSEPKSFQEKVAFLLPCSLVDPQALGGDTVCGRSSTTQHSHSRARDAWKSSSLDPALCTPNFQCIFLLFTEGQVSAFKQ